MASIEIVGEDIIFSDSRGTTILAVIGHGKVYLLPDGRSTNLDELVIGGMEVKDIEVGQMVVCYSGSVGSCKWVKNTVKEILSISKLSGEDRMSIVQKGLIKLKKKWKRNNPKKEFPCDMLFVGTSNGHRCILEFHHLANKMHYELNTIVAIGSGSEVALKHISTQFNPGVPISDEEVIENMKRAVTFAALEDQYTGGYLHGGVYGYSGYRMVGNHEHVLRIIQRCFPLYHSSLQCGHLWVTEMLEYTLENEKFVEKMIRKRFGFGDATEILKIGVKGRFARESVIVRVVYFNSVEDAQSSLELVETLMEPLENVNGGFQLGLEFSNNIVNLKVFDPTVEAINYINQTYGDFYY